MLFSISSIPLHVDSHLKIQPLVLCIFVKICCRTEQVKKKKSHQLLLIMLKLKLPQVPQHFGLTHLA